MKGTQRERKYGHIQQSHIHIIVLRYVQSRTAKQGLTVGRAPPCTPKAGTRRPRMWTKARRQEGASAGAQQKERRWPRSGILSIKMFLLNNHWVQFQSFYHYLQCQDAPTSAVVFIHQLFSGTVLSLSIYETVAHHDPNSSVLRKPGPFLLMNHQNSTLVQFQLLGQVPPAPFVFGWVGSHSGGGLMPV